MCTEATNGVLIPVSAHSVGIQESILLEKVNDLRLFSEKNK